MSLPTAVTTTSNTTVTTTTSNTTSTTSTTTGTTISTTTSNTTTTTSTTTTSTSTTTEMLRVTWASQAGGTGNDWGTYLTFDVEDNLYVTGECGLSPLQSSPASFGSTKLPCTSGQD